MKEYGFDAGSKRPVLISEIVAVDRRRAIGLQGDMLFHIPTDLRHFKAITMGKPVIMGRRTWESLPKGALPGRLNIVVTRQSGYQAPGAVTADSLSGAFAMAADAPEVMIIGGAEIYREAIPVADRLYITEIDAQAPDADTYFPEIDPEHWVETEVHGPIKDEKSGLMLKFVCLCRK